MTSSDSEARELGVHLVGRRRYDNAGVSRARTRQRQQVFVPHYATAHATCCLCCTSDDTRCGQYVSVIDRSAGACCVRMDPHRLAGHKRGGPPTMMSGLASGPSNKPRSVTPPATSEFHSTRRTETAARPPCCAAVGAACGCRADAGIPPVVHRLHMGPHQRSTSSLIVLIAARHVSPPVSTLPRSAAIAPTATTNAAPPRARRAWRSLRVALDDDDDDLRRAGAGILCAIAVFQSVPCTHAVPQRR
jgi:hypothetical protein